jgi:phospholipase/carboxylesterase
MKNYREAVKNYLVILHHKPNDVSTLYSIAGCYATLKKPELAAKALGYAIDNGLKDLDRLISDSVWNPIKNKPEFKPVLDFAKNLKKERGETIWGECKIITRGSVRQPDNYDSTKAYPLLIMLHGYGSNGDSFLNIRDKMGASGFFVTAPRGPYATSILGLNKPSYSWFYLTSDKSLWRKADPYVIDYIINIVRQVKSKHNVSGVYLLGHSQGGALTYLTGINSPELINGIICFGASNPKEYLTPTNLLKASKSLPVFISHGWDDQAVPFTDAQEAKQLFLKYNYKVTFKPYQGGHYLDNNTLIDARKWIENIELSNK